MKPGKWNRLVFSARRNVPMNSSRLPQNATALYSATGSPHLASLQAFPPIAFHSIHLNCRKMRWRCILRQIRTDRLYPASLQAFPPISSHLTRLICRILRRFQPSTITLSVPAISFLVCFKDKPIKGFRCLIGFHCPPSTSIGTVYAVVSV